MPCQSGPQGASACQGTLVTTPLRAQSEAVWLVTIITGVRQRAQQGRLRLSLTETGQLDDVTAEHNHKLVEGVRIHAKSAGLTDLNVLFDNVDRTLANHKLEAHGV